MTAPELGEHVGGNAQALLRIASDLAQRLSTEDLVVASDEVLLQEVLKAEVNREQIVVNLLIKIEHYRRLLFSFLDDRSALLKVVDNLVAYSAEDYALHPKPRTEAEIILFEEFFKNAPGVSAGLRAEVLVRTRKMREHCVALSSRETATRLKLLMTSLMLGPIR